MMDINEAVRSLEPRRLAKQSASRPLLEEEFFSAEEKTFLQGFSADSMRAIERIKRVFPKSRVTEVRPKTPESPSTDQDLRYAAMQEDLRGKCAIRGALMAELNQMWPQILKERKKQRRDRERPKTDLPA